MRSRSTRWAVLIGVIAVLAVAGYYAWRQFSVEENGYREIKITRGDLTMTILSTGVVQPRNRLEIKPPIAGRAEEVLVKEGETVSRGKVLAWMSSTERAALIDAARARGPEELKRWQELYRATPVLAPIDGTVILRNIEPGQSFTSNDAVFIMSDRLTVKAQVDETDIAQIRLRQSAQIVLDAYPNQAFRGRVDQIAYDAKTVNNVTTYEVDVLPDRTPPFMRSGMTANVSFVIAERRNVLLVPNEAIKSRDGNAQVLLAPDAPNAEPVARRLRLGVSDGKYSEVLEGLTEGDTLLVRQLRIGGREAPSSPLTPYGRKRR